MARTPPVSFRRVSDRATDMQGLDRTGPFLLICRYSSARETNPIEPLASANRTHRSAGATANYSPSSSPNSACPGQPLSQLATDRPRRGLHWRFGRASPSHPRPADHHTARMNFGYDGDRERPHPQKEAFAYNDVLNKFMRKRTASRRLFSESVHNRQLEEQSAQSAECNARLETRGRACVADRADSKLTRLSLRKSAPIVRRRGWIPLDPPPGPHGRVLGLRGCTVTRPLNPSM